MELGDEGGGGGGGGGRMTYWCLCNIYLPANIFHPHILFLLLPSSPRIFPGVFFLRNFYIGIFFSVPLTTYPSKYQNADHDCLS